MNIKLSDLEFMVGRINEATNSPKTYGQKDSEGKFCTNIGHYHLDRAYGGNKLVRTDNESGGIREITSGFVSKKELYNLLQAFLKGVNHEH